MGGLCSSSNYSLLDACWYLPNLPAQSWFSAGTVFPLCPQPPHRHSSVKTDTPKWNMFLNVESIKVSRYTKAAEKRWSFCSFLTQLDNGMRSSLTWCSLTVKGIVNKHIIPPLNRTVALETNYMSFYSQGTSFTTVQTKCLFSWEHYDSHLQIKLLFFKVVHLAEKCLLKDQTWNYLIKQVCVLLIF